MFFQKIFEPIVSQSGFQQLPCSRAIAWLYNTYALLFIQSIFQSPILHIWPCKSKPYSGMSSTKNNQRLCMHKMYHCLQKLALAFYLFLSLLTTWAQIFWNFCLNSLKFSLTRKNWYKNFNPLKMLELTKATILPNCQVLKLWKIAQVYFCVIFSCERIETISFS